jgi:DNA-binding transcriptional ArsR family regulator
MFDLINLRLQYVSVVTLTALADPKRRRIVELLAQSEGGEMSAGDINKHFRVSGAAISQHLKVLRDACLVRVKVDAQRRLYSLDPKGLDELDAWMTGIRKLWSARLDAFEAKLRARPEGPGRRKKR